jgi:predicted O-methyltransferase YrrM
MEKESVPYIYNLIEQYKPKTFCETGCHNGLSAAGIIFQMLKYNKDIYYEGYDAFEEVPKIEHNGKSMSGQLHYDKIHKRLAGIKKQHIQFDYKIIKGFTDKTLVQKTFDFVYIDGGHSYETVKHDYNMLKNSKIIIFDDYNLSGVKKAVNEIGIGELIPFEARKKKKWIIINDNQ